MGIATVTCKNNCGWITDFDTLSETNPHFCPSCGSEIIDAGTGLNYDDTDYCSIEE